MFNRIKKIFARTRDGIAVVNNHGTITQINKRVYSLVTITSKDDASVFMSTDAELWDEWESKDSRNTEFKTDESLTKLVDSIKDRISSGGTIRISGLAGIGKTRTVLEACRLLSNEEKQRIIYIPRYNGQILSLLKMLKKDQSQIVIIDDCEQIHLERIEREIADKGITLVTIDYDSYGYGSDELRFEKMSNEVIAAITKQKTPVLDQHEISAIVEASDGFPRFAIYIAEIIAKGDSQKITQFKPSDIYKLLLAGRSGYKQDQVDILKILSLFTKIGYDPNSEGSIYGYADGQYLAAPNEMDKIIDVFGLNKDDVFAVYNEFKPRSIIQRRGQSISVQPFPLSIHLAQEWYKGTHPDTVTENYNNLTPALQKRFVGKIKYLDNPLDFAKRFIGDPESPFSNAELLNSPSNELFGELAEMAPDLAMNSLEYAFEGWTSEDFKDKLTSNRRKIVWTLEKIMFNKDLYERAAAFLFRLASGENETWGNNATGILVQTMQIFLSPTEASLEQRINLLHSLKPVTAHDTAIILKMIDKGLDNDGHYSCTAGAERQGARTLKYYQPKNWLEAKEYFSQLADILVKMSQSDNKDLRKDVLKIINSNINPIMIDALFDSYEPMFSILLSEFQDMVPTFLSNSRSYTGEGFGKLVKYRESLVSKSDDDLDSQFNLYIVPYEYDVAHLMSADEDIKFDKMRSLVKQKAEEIADGYLANPDRLYTSLEMFINRDYGNMFDFAARIGSKIDDYQTFVNTLLDMHRTRGYENLTLLANAMLEMWKRDPTYIDSVLHELLHDDFWLSKNEIIKFVGSVHNGFLESDLDIILNLVAARKINAWQLKVSGLSIRLKDSVSPNKIVGFLNALYDILGSKSCDFIMETMSYYRFKDKELPKEFEPLAINLLKEPENIVDLFKDAMSGHHVSEVLHKISISDKDAISIFEAFKVATNGDEHYRLDNHGYVGSIINYLIERHPNTVLPHILNAMCKEKSRWSARWLRLLGGMGNGRMNSSSSLFSPGLDSLVIEYLDSTKKTARFNTRNNIIELVNLLRHDDGKIEWSPLIKHLIDTAETKDELERISGNISNYSWSGNTSNYYKQYVPLFKEMTTSPKSLLRSWAKETLDWLNKRIKHENDREEELGY